MQIYKHYGKINLSIKNKKHFKKVFYIREEYSNLYEKYIKEKTALI